MDLRDGLVASAKVEGAPETDEPKERLPSFLVGIGASAGGLEALERFFENTPLETGLAFVVLQHLSPDFRSLTDELLARRTKIPIRRAENDLQLKADTIYLLPPKKDMIVAGGKLLLTDKDPNQVLALPIDHFFRSLAQEAGPRAVGIVLSGTGSDGSRGIRDIAEAGGLVIAQTPESAKFDGMPKSAVQTGVVHFSLAPEEMPAALLRYMHHPLSKELALVPQPAVPESAMEAIFRLLRKAYDIDFSHYKPETVARRTERRLLLNQVDRLDDYVERLASDPEELNKLYKDLLIGVTRFFRDKEVFDHLATRILPDYLRRRRPEEEIRVWVAGCATGEEAYSLAILLIECCEALGRSTNIKVFATDVHRASLEIAGLGFYSDETLVDVDQGRLNRFFTRKDDGYYVHQDLRRAVIFAHHNVIKDAPFTRLDLISCRNLLIYFQPLGQKKALSLFHFGLKTGATLVLGPSESPGDLTDEFETLDHRWKIYRKRRDIRLQTDVRLPTLSPASRLGILPSAPPHGYDNQLLGSYDALLHEFVPTSLLVDEERRLVQSFAGASKFLKPRDGRFTADVLEMIDPDLKVPLTAALQRVFRDRMSMSYHGLRIGPHDAERLMNLTIRPILNQRSGAVQALITLEEMGEVPSLDQSEEVDIRQASRDHVLTLETELRYAKENLQATIEELETSNEELQATNEELVASNEELQSTNEELHSVNEELYTVNAEYQKKIAELTEMTTDMDNLLASTQVHTIFLDKWHRIRKFTPMLTDTFNLLPQDVGRRIDSFTHNIEYPDLMSDIKTVLDTGEIIEKQVQDRKGNWLFLRVLPYRAGSTTEGVVLTLIEINNLKKAEKEISVLHRHLGSILHNSPNVIFIKDLERKYTLVGDAFRQRVEVDPIGKTAYELYPPETARTITALEDRVLAEGAVIQTEIVIPQADGGHIYLGSRFPLRDETGRIIAIGGIETDVTPLKQAEKQAREGVTQRDQFLAMLSHELRNPLAAILNAARTIEKLGAAKHLTNWIQVIERRSRHMARLLDDLLDVSRITQNKIEIRRQPFDLAQLVPEVLEEVRPWFGNQVELDVHDPTEPLLVEGDAHRLQQIQVNLLLNAAKYTPAGGKVWYSMRREDNQAVIRVRDTGCGIAADMLESIFEPFVQGERTLDRTGGGLGVGLTLVRSIALLHGGQVRAFSDGPGRGCEFVVWLPLASAKPVETSPPQTPIVPAHKKDSLRILLVEDDADIRDSLQTILEHDGYRVRTAPDGPAALEMIEHECPDVAFVDIGLPGMDGYEIARQVRQKRPRGEICLVALTGYGRASDKEAAFDAGFDVHLTKPLKLTDLYQLLAKTPQNLKKK